MLRMTKWIRRAAFAVAFFLPSRSAFRVPGADRARNHRVPHLPREHLHTAASHAGRVSMGSPLARPMFPGISPLCASVKGG